MRHFGPSIAHFPLSANQLRFKASHIRIANRKRVEMFVAKRFHLPTRLATAAPDIAAEWHDELNPMHMYPAIIGIGHVQPVWWKCAICSHSYQMSVEKRVVRGGGCPQCVVNGKRAVADGALEGEMDSQLRPKRPVMFNMRTKY
ncbi:protein of unknown function (DUF4379), putative [Trypanosoma equiperdum]|uniref:Treble clef zinc finger domain-containing protein n=4 Tax=Trypanozoon TaxID=39700 RepID=Q581T4_TRYB2|nr:hypothetical protein, conserved [Trypanosoma brucei gambiense DAL972]XP_844297.1 hypothetical protein, conserved [Trypanosoma brucei brucei TREU927]6SGA_Fd Chain Fd, mt-SAF33 [Trypanosoma brucei brucei]6SGB_Fd Chain Fd, mt-SAF33 [Trypanosoma brucei brucei]7PUA_Fd Chain Fd, DUF4379 domain-containing protein [Trypanosoma brucei brucei]AAX79886.1 hypothetical protein, conserved [Trypanosoma brucei]RHW73359.1 hypothetical protein DPX39_040017400 [Trypanosoma brucei equiperdum]SCU66810.1 Domai|eukprot:XP_011772715.1 hypothetical protein, conserved [Trypanosoma brucei gambiense DAL972]